MKKLTFLLFTYFICAFSANAQIKINEDTLSMSQGLKNGFSVEMLQIAPEDAGKRWAKYLKKYKGKTKKSKNLTEWFTNDAKMKLISNNTVDLYAVFTPIQDGTRLIVWYDLGGTYLNSEIHGERAITGKKVLYDFALATKKEQALAKIEEEKEKLSQIQGNLDKLSKNEIEFLKTIEDLKAKIATLEADVKETKSTQSKKQAELQAQKKLIDELQKKLDTIK